MSYFHKLKIAHLSAQKKRKRKIKLLETQKVNLTPKLLALQDIQRTGALQFRLLFCIINLIINQNMALSTSLRLHFSHFRKSTLASIVVNASRCNFGICIVMVNFRQYIKLIFFSRQAALRVASVAPIFQKTSHAEVQQSRPHYPNVYDSQSQAKQSAGGWITVKSKSRKNKKTQ